MKYTVFQFAFVIFITGAFYIGATKTASPQFFSPSNPYSDLTSAPPQNPHWEKFYTRGHMNFYYDPDLIKSRGNAVVVTILSDLPVINGGTSGLPEFKSAISVVAIDCVKRSRAPENDRYWSSLADFYYSGTMAMGTAKRDPLRNKNIEWGLSRGGPGQYFSDELSQVNLSYLVFQQLDRHIKTCANFWDQSGAVKEPDKAGLVPFVDKLTSSERGRPAIRNSQIFFDKKDVVQNDEKVVMKIVIGTPNDTFKKYDFASKYEWISEGYTLNFSCVDRSYFLTDHMRFTGQMGAGQAIPEKDIPDYTAGTHFLANYEYEEIRENFPDFCRNYREPEAPAKTPRIQNNQRRKK
jgi:hypothetical protein